MSDQASSLACPACLIMLPSRVQSHPTRDAYLVKCPRCGDFALSRSAAVSLARPRWDDEMRAALSHRIAKAAWKTNAGPLITTYLLDAVEGSLGLPNAAEQANNLVRLIGRHTAPGRVLAISDEEHRAVIGALDREGTIFVLQGATQAGLVESKVDLGGRSPARLSFAGWRYFEELERGASTSGRAFMAMQYGNTALDEVFQSCFRPAVEAAGFKLERLDENPRPGLIDNRLRVEIQTSRLLVVDLTAQNRGAYWEAGYAEGLGKPVIYTCRRDEFERTHFDANHQQMVIWEPGDLSKARSEITAIVRVALPGEARMTDA